MNYIFYQTKTKFTNTGDVLINNALITVLRNYGKLYANCGGGIPEGFINELGVSEEEKIIGNSEATFVKNIFKHALLKEKKDRVYLFSGLGDSYGGNSKQVLRNIVSSMIFAMFRLSGVKIVRIGRSVGPMTKAMQLTEKFRSKFISYNYVRDSKTLERCQKYGIKNVKYCPDMSWLYDYERLRNINYTNTIMVNLRNTIFDDVDERFVNTTLRSLDLVLEAFYAHYGEKMKVIVAYQMEEDANFSELVYARLKEKYNATYIDHQMKLNELEKYYGIVDYHISNRMHSLFGGYKYGSLPVALIDVENHTKISATLKDCGLDELSVDIYKKDIKSEVEYLILYRNSLMNHMFGVETSMQKKIRDILDDIFEIS